MSFIEDERYAVWAHEAAVCQAFEDPTVNMLVQVRPRPSLKVISGEGRGGEYKEQERPALRVVSALVANQMVEVEGV